MTAPASALVLTGGHSHPRDLSEPTLTAVLREAGLQPEVSEDPDAGLAGLVEADHDLVVVNILRWTMGHPRYDEFRDRWWYSPSPPARQGLLDWVARGRPLLALHSALVSFDDWPEWGRVIGGAWDWDRSHHPPVGTVDVRYEPGHPLTAGLHDFTVTDECYVDLHVWPGNDVLARATADGCHPQPVCWLREVDGGRVATDTLGHDGRSLDHPGHRALLGRLIHWLLAGPSASTDPSPEDRSLTS